jgi:hypothetical protein
MACEELKAALTALQKQHSNLEKIIATMPAPEKAAAQHAAQAQLNAINAHIGLAAAVLNKCLALNSPPPPVKVPAPANILSITPIFPDTPANLVATRDAFLNSIQGKIFPTDIGREWAQPLSPNEDYDDLLTSCSGWMVHPRDVGADFPFSHPFGIDWEFSMALDRPANGAGQFDYLLTPGNKVDGSKFPADQQSEQKDDEDLAAAWKFNFPEGLLGIEMDGTNVPAVFKQNVKEGDRVAVFGRWIVDTGHPMHRGEIHPPLMMATASVTPTGSTKAIFTSRPYLVSQVYTTDQGSIYQDSSGDDGPFYSHLLTEIIKINEFRSTLIEAHPKIKQNPMRGVNLMRFQVRPPTPAHGVAGGAAAPLQHLEVSFHFTVRTGVGIQLISSAEDTVDVLVVLNSAGYKAPPLPHNVGKRYSQSELSAANNEVGSGYLKVEALSAAIHLILPGSVIGSAVVAEFLSRGIQGDVYDSQTNQVNPLATAGAVMNAAANNIPHNAGITVDDNQPYPVTGWVEVKWVGSLVTRANELGDLVKKVVIGPAVS